MLLNTRSRTRMRLALLPALSLSLFAPLNADNRGFLRIDGKVRFPIGSYETPGDDAALKAMADAGINLFRCGGAEQLDRVGDGHWHPSSKLPCPHVSTVAAGLRH